MAVLKGLNCSISLISAGKEFHIRGPATLKERSANVDFLVKGTLKIKWALLESHFYFPSFSSSFLLFLPSFYITILLPLYTALFKLITFPNSPLGEELLKTRTAQKRVNREVAKNRILCQVTHFTHATAESYQKYNNMDS